MPGRDGTGPMGTGAMTGRGAGWCAGYGVPGYSNPLPGRGFGVPFGGGRGFFGGRGGRGRRNMYYATGLPGWAGYGSYNAPPPFAGTDPVSEKQNLMGRADALQSELDLIRRRLDEMETGGKSI